jgi:hypothetical protein
MSDGMHSVRRMKTEERVRAARLAYIRAVALVRSDPGPVGWARLLTAARELNAATNGHAHRSAEPAETPDSWRGP